MSKVAIKSGISSLSSWFVWGAISQLISVVIMKRMKLVVVYKPRGARMNSVLHVKHKPTWCVNLLPFDIGVYRYLLCVKLLSAIVLDDFTIIRSNVFQPHMYRALCTLRNVVKTSESAILKTLHPSYAPGARYRPKSIDNIQLFG